MSQNSALYSIQLAPCHHAHGPNCCHCNRPSGMQQATTVGSRQRQQKPRRRPGWVRITQRRWRRSTASHCPQLNSSCTTAGHRRRELIYGWRSTKRAPRRTQLQAGRSSGMQRWLSQVSASNTTILLVISATLACCTSADTLRLAPAHHRTCTQ